MQKSVVKNYIYNLIYQIFLLVLPVFVMPYVARTLGAVESGKYAYAQSINSYFCLFGAFGFAQYGQRLVAMHQGDKYKQSIDFWEIEFLKAMTVLVTTIVYIITILLGIYHGKHVLLMHILLMNIIAVFFDITFFFQGNEEFGKIVLRNVLIRLIGILCTFLFVKEKEDLWKYVFVQSVTTLAGALSLWFFLPHFLMKVSIKDIHPFRHMKSVAILFLPTIAISIYTTLDKTLIGIITGRDSEVGNYEYAEKLVKMPLTIVTSLGTVLIPQNSRKYISGDVAGFIKNIHKSIQFVCCVGCPLMFGIIAVADNVIPWYLGTEYTMAAKIMQILAPIVLVIGFSNVLGMQYLIPSKQDRKYMLAIVCGTLINFILNIILIRYVDAYGAALSTLIAELVITIIMFNKAKRDIKIKVIATKTIKYFIYGAIMFGICYILGNILLPSVVNSMIIVFTGGIVYFFELIISRDEMIIWVFDKVKRRFKI